MIVGEINNYRNRFDKIRYANNGNHQILGLPPLGSERFGTFWNKRMVEVKSLLYEKNIIE